jgi:leishmanolysin
MADYEVYRARADQARAEALAATTSPFTIEVRFLGGLTPTQQGAFTAAADRWAGIIVGDLPDILVDQEIIDDLVILAQGVPIDGPGKILGQAGPTHIRPEAAGAAALIPAKGIMSFDTDDLAKMESEGTLHDVIAHEMGHVLGLGTIWDLKGLLKDGGTANPTFIGDGAVQEFGLLQGDGTPKPVPVENTGGPGTADGHWRESVFKNELMTGFVGQAGNPLSRMTAASFGDLGYQVDLDAAEPFELPDLFALAVEGALVAHTAPTDVGMVLPVIPIVLPAGSLQSSSAGRG